MKDLRQLPKLRDSWSYLYVEKCRIDRQDKAIAVWDKTGVTAVPCANLSLLMLGPGVSITHSAMATLARNGCDVLWCGEHGVRCYAFGTGETRSSALLMRQAIAWADPELHMRVVLRMYEMRFGELLPADVNMQEVRGREGARVRTTYQQASRITGVPWHGRSYNRGDWGGADDVNRALSAANSCLYGVCHAAVISLGLSPGLGFVHTGRVLSFVYDVADLYKTETTIPAAFSAAALGEPNVERQARILCRDAFRETKLLSRVASDLTNLFSVQFLGLDQESEDDVDAEACDGDDPALPGGLWDPNAGSVQGGMNYQTDSNEGSREG